MERDRLEITYENHKLQQCTLYTREVLTETEGLKDEGVIFPLTTFSIRAFIQHFLSTLRISNKIIF